MTLLLETAIKTSAVVGLSLAAQPLLRRQSAALRHWVLAAALASAALMPALALVVPAWRLPSWAAAEQAAPRSAAPIAVYPSAAPAAAVGNARSLDVASAPHRGPGASIIFAVMWAVGALLSTAALLGGLARLRRIASRATPVDDRWADLTRDLARESGVRRRVAVLFSDHPSLLVTWGVVRPKIVLPLAARGWSDARARIVMRHELAHVSRGDWLALIVAEIARGLNWFNPLLWFACRQLRRESERACDDAVLRGGVGGAEYASHLVALARTLRTRRRPSVLAPAMARPSGLERRIDAMLSTRINRTPLTRSARLAAAVVLFVAAGSVAGLRGQRLSTLSGTITDQTNAVLPGVTVTVTNPTAQTRHEVRTDRTGHFELPGLTDGDYQVAIDPPGFTPVNDAITLSGRDLVRTWQLTVGDLHETINITAGGRPLPPDPGRRQEARDYAAARGRTVAERCAARVVDSNVGGNIMAPMKVVDFKPRYPENLQAAKVGGVVTLEALIGTDGTIRDVRLVTGDPDLGAAAADAIRQWEFSPTYLNCTPIEVRMAVTANFVVK